MKAVYRVWSKPSDNSLYESVGVYDTLAAAQASLLEPHPWHLASSGNWVTDSNPLVFIAPDLVPETLEDRTELALDLIADYGSIAGGHHKAWVLDQVARMLAGDAYEEWKASTGKGLPAGVAP